MTAQRKRPVLSLTVTEGLYFGNLWTDGFEPVRVQHFFTRKWREVQPVAEAASKVGEFIRQRPDLGFEGST